jgi:hypothetical protein
MVKMVTKKFHKEKRKYRRGRTKCACINTSILGRMLSWINRDYDSFSIKI